LSYLYICGFGLRLDYAYKQLFPVESFVCRSWKHHQNNQHDKAIEALQHYFTQIVSGVSIRRLLKL